MEPMYLCEPLAYVYDEYTLLEACIERDVEAVQTILDDNPTEEELNERDRSGRTPLSHACSNGLLPVVMIMAEIPEVDVNLPDKEGNSPIIFAAQAGHSEIVKTLINDYPKIRIDQKNKFGMTALIKAAIQGRTKCAKVLLYAGANAKIKDTIRRYTAEEWARFCGRKECAGEIAKFTENKNMLLSASKKKIHRSNSEPDLVTMSDMKPHTPVRAKSRSFRRSLKKLLPTTTTTATATFCVNISINSMGADNPLAVVARCVSTPILPDAVSSNMVGSMKRPVSADNIPTVKITTDAIDDVITCS